MIDPVITEASQGDSVPATECRFFLSHSLLVLLSLAPSIQEISFLLCALFNK